ncbi:selenophosphate synthetase [Nonlabens sp. Asnod2-A12]|uniref:selenophosphate synthetase n=1 Tax=Nonlabens sp. Asnod2-A12 TaxID=3160578 RepID=UPI0038668ED0
MKKAFLLLSIIALITSCKNDSKSQNSLDNEIEKETAAITIAQHLAENAGISNWNNVEEIKFSFNVGKDGRTVLTRNWKWNPNTDNVQLIALGDTINYNRNSKLDSIQASTDRGFINDVYWLIPEFKLVWDEGTEITEKKSQIAPISKEKLDMITILYNNEGGYTPGDAYDIYYDKDHKFKEWAYRSKNDSMITMATTFKEYKTIEGITIATDHLTPDGFTRINFTDIEIIKKK